MIRSISDMVKRFCLTTPCEDCPMRTGHGAYTETEKNTGAADWCCSDLTEWFIDEAYMRRANLWN